MLLLLVVVAVTVFYEVMLNFGNGWITYVYVIAACAAAGAYMIIMRGLYTHPDKTVFSYDLPEEERVKLAEAHRRHYFAARPLLFVIIAVAAVIIYMIRKKRRGEGCSCNCEGCAFRCEKKEK